MSTYTNYNYSSSEKKNRSEVLKNMNYGIEKLNMIQIEKIELNITDNVYLYCLHILDFTQIFNMEKEGKTENSENCRYQHTRKIIF